MGDAPQPERQVIVHRPVVGLVCPVEGFVVVVEPVGDLPAALDVGNIGAALGVCHFLVGGFHGIQGIVSQLAADQQHYEDGQHLFAVLFLLDEQQDGVSPKQTHGYPDGALGIQIIKFPMLVLLVQHQHQEHEPHKEAAVNGGGLGFLQLLERHGSHGEDHEGENEGVPEGQPVGHLSAVPHHIHGTDVHAGEQCRCQQAHADLLAQGDLAVQEEQGQQQGGDQTAVDLRHTLDVDGIVLCHRGDLGKEVNGGKLELEGVIRVGGKIEFTKRQCVVYRQNQYRRHHQSHHRAQEHPQDAVAVCLQILALHAEMLELVGADKQVVGEVQGGEDADHEADVEVCKAHQRQWDDVVDLSAVVDQILHAQADQGQEHQTVQPHGVDQLGDGIRHHGVHHGEQQGVQRLQLPGFLQEVAEGDRCGAQLAKLHDEQTAQDHGAGQENDNQSKGTCQIVADDTEELTGQVPGPVVENTAVPPERIPDGFKVVHILSVQIQAQNRFRAKGIHAEQGICQIGQCHGNEERQDVDIIPGAPALEPLKEPDLAQRGQLDLGLGSSLHGLVPLGLLRLGRSLCLGFRLWLCLCCQVSLRSGHCLWLCLGRMLLGSHLLALCLGWFG